ncbi:flavin-containing monooxygenase [Nonomuraea maritima]|uniref:flavin-containing monooxygenase n=1 Tax=Nonomuraea maritima TaxID=683260 RepID=UPI0037113DFD
MRFDAIVVGAGFSGMYMLHRLRGLGLSVRVFEAGDGVGGTWYWNRYPGARCDVESMEYSFSFDRELEQEWEWSERYASQPEILRYAEHVADRFDLRRDITFGTRVTGAAYDEADHLWRVETDGGERVAARWLITAVGCLSAARVPDFPGASTFGGASLHTGRWPHEGVDFSGLRVAVIGTGSSGIQSIPVIADQAEHVTVFQRTPNFSVPAHNRPLTPEYQNQVKADYPDLRRQMRESMTGLLGAAGTVPALEVTQEERTREFEARWARGGIPFLGAFTDIAVDPRANELAAEFVRGKIREIVSDARTAELLMPRDHPIGSKRICVDTGYFATYNRPDVTLVDVRSDPIEEITPTGVRTAAAHHEVDVIVYATGFDAMTGPLLRLGITGRGGLSLKRKWEAGPRTYLGLMSAGFPNLFTITGPGSPSVLSNMIVSIEQHVDWIADCVAWLHERGVTAIDADPQAEKNWTAHVDEVSRFTLYPQANSWYMGANIPGKPRVFMPYVGGVGAYRLKCDQVAADGYEGFLLSS